MARNKLKALEVQRAECKLFDGGGLYLVKRNPTVGFWLYRYKFQGRSRKTGLGSYPQISLANARKARDEWTMVLQSGKDPIQHRDRQREEERAELHANDPTFEEAAQITFDAMRDGLRADGASGKWMSPLRLYMIPAIGKRRMSMIHQTEMLSYQPYLIPPISVVVKCTFPFIRPNKDI